MRFEERELKPYAEYVVASTLKEGDIYFSLFYINEEMLIPMLVPFVFIGWNLNPNDEGLAYFQEVESYAKGVRWDSAHSGAELEAFEVSDTGDLGGIFEYGRALEELMRCALRRRNVLGVE